ncbi:uncharacterized protein LOC118425820 isoform X2 [Branchiostoma floridae]|uniref:Uncharacterized protein LOC118425820 isoform X2 n=1 Tax=Branchiostoma floridae TaxID=7739 RepID=A0A9J7N5Z7_BRAFL|nr:uncharacterized protein LOC118425820 isoform X2 [Branchiostoma floridae]
MPQNGASCGLPDTDLRKMAKVKKDIRNFRGRTPFVKKTSVNSADGRTTVSRIPLLGTQPEAQDSQASTSATAELPVIPVPAADPEPTLPQTQTAYCKQKTRELESWNKVRDLVYQTSVELASPISFICTTCRTVEESLIFRCKECGPVAMFCIECLREQHKDHKSFHVPDKWEGTFFRPYHLSHTLHLPHHADCPTRYCKSVKVFDPAGRLQYFEVAFCDCEQISCTLLRYGLWGSTVSDPQTAFATSLLEWLVMFTLEAQVSVEAFCKAVRYKNNLSLSETNTLYRSLIGQSIAEFRHFMYRVRTMKDLCPLLDDGTTCPACPKKDGTQIIALDGNFGLVRKQSSGTSSGPPLHGTTLFMEDDRVQDFVEKYKKKDDGKQVEELDCSNFRAGSIIRSQGKQKKLDVSGVFGSVCRHEIPRCFLNMIHGERFAYPVCLIEELLADVAGRNIKLKKTRQNDLLGKVTLALDVFHSYGHKTSCQLNYSTRRLPGFGLTDGEAVERMWAFLRRFSRITKEMTPTRRLDLLTDGLLHYSRRKTLDIEVALVKKKQSAEKAGCVAKEGLDAVMADANVSMDDIKSWAQREKDVINTEKQSTSKEDKWKTLYVTKLLQLKTVREQILSMGEESSDVDVYQSSFLKLDQQLSELERTHRISARWSTSSHQFVATMKEVDLAVRSALLSRMRGLSYERCFLTSLKRKYPDGQAISLKLARQLTTTNTKLQKTVDEYNAVATQWEPKHPNFPVSIQFREATDPSWQTYLCLDPNMLEEPGLPRSVQRRAIEHLNLLQRAEEEVEMVRQEMKDVFNHFQTERELVEAEIMKCDDLTSGRVATLTTHVVMLEKRLVSMYDFFRHHDPDLELPTVKTTYLVLFPFKNPDCLDYICDSLSEDESECDDEALPDVDSWMDDDNDCD